MKEKNAVWSFVSFSSEKETKEPWPPLPLYLGDVMMDPDPELYLYKQLNLNMILINSLTQPDNLQGYDNRESSHRTKGQPGGKYDPQSQALIHNQKAEGKIDIRKGARGRLPFEY